MQTYYISRIGGVAAIAALLAAGVFAIGRARADFQFRQQSPGAVARAVALQPGNTEYLALRALQIDYGGGDPRPLLQRAAELNPLSSAPRIRLGLDAEIRGDYATAEKWLLDAARIDRQFEPRWTLANFYFRRQDRQAFWKWMREALAVSYGDRRPAFELCWQTSTDANEILSRAFSGRREALAAYLGWLLETHRTQAIAPVALKLAPDADDRALVLAGDDALLESGDGAGALALWRAMGFAAPGGVYRGNFGDFKSRAAGHGFDWRWNETAGVVHAEIDAPRTMHRISFDGTQPESCELLRQTLLLKRGEHYRLRWQASVNQMESPTGIEWRIGETHAGVGNGTGEMEFVAPADVAQLNLVYQRPNGEARAEGMIELWGVSIR
ncbi:MAG TPA: hypothetical protein VMB85_02645 [Bryobacteraceae bacterium]|nr:hypothetical protein [Bryobacteraceae bacterium]